MVHSELAEHWIFNKIEFFNICSVYLKNLNLFPEFPKIFPEFKRSLVKNVCFEELFREIY